MLAPKLRFKDDNGEAFLEWERKYLYQLTQRVTRKNKENNKNILTISAQQGLINQEKFFNKLVSAKNVQNYYLLYKNEFAYNKSYSKGYPMGAIKKLTNYDKGVVSTLYICFNFIEGNDSYFEQYFESGKHNKELEKVAQEGARNHGLLNLGINDFFNRELLVPSAKEQTKIANFLTTLDVRISQQEKQCQLLEQYKKGMMQQLFGQELRFKDDNGEEFPEWESKKLEELGSFFSGGTPLTTEKNFFNGDIPFIKSGEISSSTTEQNITLEGLEHSSAKLVEKGDILYALYGATSGEVAILKISGAINQAVLCIRTSLNNYFLYSYLLYSKSRIIRTYLQGGQGNLSAQIIKQLAISVPDIKEQTKIAHFLSILDDKITLAKQQLEQLNTYKKGLLQQLFI